MTEASHQMTSNPLPQNGPHKPGTVGTAQGSVQARRPNPTCTQLPCRQMTSRRMSIMCCSQHITSQPACLCVCV